MIELVVDNKNLTEEEQEEYVIEFEKDGKYYASAIWATSFEEAERLVADDVTVVGKIIDMDE